VIQVRSDGPRAIQIRLPQVGVIEISLGDIVT
jgi:hypothetical protein